MKRILILSAFFSPNLGGAETHLDDLCEYLRKNGFYVYVLTYQPLVTKIRGLALEKKENLEVHRVSWFGMGWFNKLEPYPLLEFLYLFPGLFFYTVIFCFKNHQKIDVIHAHGFIPAIITRLLTTFYPKRTVMSLHAIYEFHSHGVLRFVANWILKEFDVILPLAQASKNDLLSAGVEEKKIRIYSQWVNQKLFKPLDKEVCRKRLNLENKFIVLFVGRLIKKKGAVVLVDVAANMPNVDFIFVGDGPQLTGLRNGASNNTIFVGKKTQEETAFLYGAADIIAVPSLYKEGFARVVLEAISSGRPVIASNKGCLPEMIPPSVGIIINPTVNNFKKEIDDLLNNSTKLERLSKNAAKYGRETFNEKNASKIADAYCV